MEYLFNAAIKGLIEGFTEFLPISSTAHLVLVRHLLPLTGDVQAQEALDNMFDIVIQFPAIMAIVILYWNRLWPSLKTFPREKSSQHFWISIAIAFIPAGVIGVLAKNFIEQHLHQPIVIASALIIGGLILLIIEKLARPSKWTNAQTLPFSKAFNVGLMQCLGMIPGTSRSGATIIGARLLGLNRIAAAEFSFFLAIPTLGGATVYKLYKDFHTINWTEHWLILIIGSLVSFISAWAVVKVFMKLIETKHGFTMWGWYRIILGIIIISTIII